MRALNIVIRRMVYEALSMLDSDDQGTAKAYCSFQMSTVNDYMEAPGSPELERAYAEVTQA
jgi:hypothetical protein